MPDDTHKALADAVEMSLLGMGYIDTWVCRKCGNDAPDIDGFYDATQCDCELHGDPMRLAKRPRPLPELVRIAEGWLLVRRKPLVCMEMYKFRSRVLVYWLYEETTETFARGHDAAEMVARAIAATAAIVTLQGEET